MWQDKCLRATEKTHTPNLGEKETHIVFHSQQQGSGGVGGMALEERGEMEKLDLQLLAVRRDV